jgi:hypothetical protein
MGKKRRDQGSGEKDALGSVLQTYQVTLGGVLLVAGVVAFVGVGLTIYGLTGGPYALIFLIAGAAVLLFAVVLLGINIFNVGRRLELRKRGVRFVEAGITTEFFWDEIVDVEVNRTDNTNLGVATVRKRSADAVSPSGLLTNTEWDVTIHGRDGRTIRLRPAFLRTVADPKKLISQLRLRAGLP